MERPSQTQIFLAREINRTQNYSEKTAELIDSEIKRIIEENYTRAKEILEEHRETLENLAKALLEYESLDAKEIDAVIEGRPLPTRDDSGDGGSEEEKEKAKKGKSLFSPSTPPLPALNEDPEKA